MAINSHTVIFCSIKLNSTHLLSFIINGSVLFHNEVTAYQKKKKAKKKKKHIWRLKTAGLHVLFLIDFQSPPCGHSCLIAHKRKAIFLIPKQTVLFKQSRIAWLWSKLGNRIGVDLYSTRWAVHYQAPCHFTTNKVKVAAIRNTK